MKEDPRLVMLPPGNHAVVAVDQAGSRATGIVEARETG